MKAPVLELHGVGKAFGRSALFRSVDFSISRGVCVALTGRNGAGKTTVLRIAAGLVSATEGEVRRAKGLSIGYVPEHFPRFNLTVRQFLCHMGAIEGLEPAGIEEGMRLFSDFFMEDLIDLPMGRLSKGTLQKVAVVQALLRPRDLLILDEPLSGQDEKSQRVFIGKVLEAKRAGAAVLLSCHEPLLTERLADAAFRLDADGLKPVRMGEGAPHALLAFEPDREVVLPPEVRCYRRDGRLYATVPRDMCDRLIVEMIEKGFSRRSPTRRSGSQTKPPFFRAIRRGAAARSSYTPARSLFSAGRCWSSENTEAPRFAGLRAGLVKCLVYGAMLVTAMYLLYM